MGADEEYIKFKEKFRLDELELERCGNWTVSLRPQQATLGSLVVSLARPCMSFSELEPSEGDDLLFAYKAIETALREFIVYEKINYLALMMVDAHLHFHVIPRYAREKIFAGMKFEDKGWPKLPDLASNELSDDTLLLLAEELKRIFVSQRKDI